MKLNHLEILSLLNTNGHQLAVVSEKFRPFTLRMNELREIEISHSNCSTFTSIDPHVLEFLLIDETSKFYATHGEGEIREVTTGELVDISPIEPSHVEGIKSDFAIVYTYNGKIWVGDITHDSISINKDGFVESLNDNAFSFYTFEPNMPGVVIK